jgi:phospholipid:diacylglycerol acyltransferase
MAPYDWRLSMYNLEERDGYFSALKTTIEGLK